MQTELLAEGIGILRHLQGLQMAKRKRQPKSSKGAVEKSSGRNRLPLIWKSACVVAIGILTGLVFLWPLESGEQQPTASDDGPLTQDTPEISLADRPAWEQLDNAKHDGWETEVLYTQAKHQLDEIGKVLAHGDQISTDELQPFVTADFSCGALVPSLRRINTDSHFVVQRTLADQAEQSGDSYSGATGMAEAVNRWVGMLKETSKRRFEHKIFRVDVIEDGFTTHQHVSFSGKSLTAVIETHAVWTIRWHDRQDGTSPRLRRIDVSEFEATETKGSGGSLFADCTEAVLGRNACYSEQLLLGMNHWLERIPFRAMLTRFGTPGIALGDVNGDGLDDLYLCQEWGLPNRLFIQNPDGTLRDVSKSWGVDWLEDSRSVLLVDLDNDGDQDLVVAVYGNIVVASNEAQREFRVQKVLPTSESTSSLSAVDYDLDGRLDLYVCGYAPNKILKETGAASIGVVSRRFVYHDDNNGAANTLYRNESEGGNWKFTDVTESVGLDENNRRWSLAAAWEDFDNDGDADLYVANDYGRNNLHRNERTDDKHRFIDVAAAANAEDSASGMSVVWGDYDRDGWMDVYVSNMFSAAGSRITFQSRFKPEASLDVRQRLRRFVRGNTLLRNLGSDSTSANPRFADASIAEGVTMGRWAWGSSFADLDNDGWEDLVVANGYLTTEDTGDL